MDAWGPASTVPASVVASAGEEARCSLGCYAVCSFLSRKTAAFCWLLSSESVRLVGLWLFTGGTLGAVRPPSPSHGKRRPGEVVVLAGPLCEPPSAWGRCWRANGQPRRVLPSPPGRLAQNMA